MNEDAYNEVVRLCAELGITGQVRADMLADAERAVGVLRHALEQGKRSRGKLRSPAALAIANWRSGFDPREPYTSPAPILPEPTGPPSLSALEHMWSMDPSPHMEALLRMAAASIGKHGGFSGLRSGFDEREHYHPETGELLEVDTDA